MLSRGHGSMAGHGNTIIARLSSIQARKRFFLLARLNINDKLISINIVKSILGALLPIDEPLSLQL